MRIHFTIVVFFLIVNIHAFSQNGDRQKIDSLKKVLPVLNDSGKIDCLNDLSEAYHWFETDTARIFAKQALNEAEKIRYTQGIAKAYRNLGRIETVLNTDLPAAEKYFSLSLSFFLKIPDNRELGWAWGALGYSKWVLSKFPEAMKAYENAVQLLEKSHDTSTLSIVYNQMSNAALEWGQYDEALQYALKGKELTGKEDYAMIGGLYSTQGDYETALEYFRQWPQNEHNWQFKYLNIGSTFFYKKNYDSAFYYYQLFSDWAKTAGEGSLSKSYAHLGELHFALRHYNTALMYLNNALIMHKRATDRNQVMHVLWTLGNAYKETNDYKKAMQTKQELLQLSNATGARQYSRNAHLLLYWLFDQLKKQDSAYTHLQQYIILKDSIDLDLSAHKLAFYKTKTEREKAAASIKVLNEEKKLQQQQLKQTALQNNFLITGIAALLLIGTVLFRNISLKRKNERNLHILAENELKMQKLESERKQADLQQQATELEMQVLRAQMNPHFIFNCLNAINGFILTNESEIAADYLTKFSRLIRMILNNSQKKFISLEEELETLRLYLYMESLRFQNSFCYKINCDDTIDALSVYIPPLLFQPFVENAIWHGLMHKEGDGELVINLHCENGILHCTIRDNGIGRKKAAMLKSKSAAKSKSMGMQITKSRMVLLNEELNGESYFEILDMEDASGNATGTLVSLKVKVKEMTEENALQNRW